MSYQQSALVSAYIDAQTDDETKRRLTKLRALVQSFFPTTIEDISYGMPTYRPAPKKRGIVHFAVFPKHIGLYAIFDPNDSPELLAALKPYRTGKGTLQFLHSEPFPTALIQRLLSYHATH